MSWRDEWGDLFLFSLRSDAATLSQAHGCGRAHRCIRVDIASGAEHSISPQQVAMHTNQCQWVCCFEGSATVLLAGHVMVNAGVHRRANIVMRVRRRMVSFFCFAFFVLEDEWLRDSMHG